MDIGSIFKAYDIRGTYGAELTENVAYKSARGFAQLLKKENPDKTLTLGLGRDMRTSSPALHAEVLRGLLEEGIQVMDMGIVSTPAFYFAVAQYNYDGGLMITASHNPPKDNGIKMVRAGVSPVSGNSGIHTIRDMVLADAFEPVAEATGTVTAVEGIISEHVDFAIEQIGTDGIRPLKIIADAANAMGATYLHELFAHLPECEITELNFELDGTFPAHEADPFKEENLEQLSAAVRESGADLGIATDGDGDRIFFVDNEGVMIEPAIVRGLMAILTLEQETGATICYDIRPGRITRDLIEEHGGVPCVTKVGHSFIKAKAIEVGAAFAGESSGHFFNKTKLGMFETPVMVALQILKYISRSEAPVTEQIASMRRYWHSGEINSEVEDKQGIMDALMQQYGPDAVSTSDMDGITIEYADFWFNVRPSNTEPKLRLNLEAINEEIGAAKRDEILGIIRS